MASVWKRLQRVNKRAAKFQYTASYHRVDLETSPKWKPNKLSVVWTRRSRRVLTDPLEWEPSLKDPLKGSVIYAVPENQTVAVTLFKDSRTNELEDKDWTFVLEDVSVTGKRRRLAVASINMRAHASLEPTQRALAVHLDPVTNKVLAATIHLTLHCVLLREGQATDEDMQSLASLLSVNNNSDIAVLEDLDEDWVSDTSTRHMSDFRQQMEELTLSLTHSSLATPSSVPSLALDAATPTPTPTPGHPPDTPTNHPLPYHNDYHFDTNVDSSTPIDTGFKEVVFKPTTVAKRNLKPLELKTNLNSIGLDGNDNEREDDKTPTGDADGLGPFDKDKTPVQDLLEWCQGATREYRACRVTNLTTSFRSGLAFCAIIHHYRPDLIDYSGLQPDECENNVRIALDASGALGVPPVLAAGDVCRNAPDRLAIMTYLFQLRAHFTGGELQVEQLGNDETESSYLVGRHDTDGSLPRDLFSREISVRRSRNTIKTQPVVPRSVPEARPPAAGRGGGAGGQPRAGLKPTARWFDSELTAAPHKLMTRKDLTDPFGDDDDDEEKNPPGKHDTNETAEIPFSDPLNVLSQRLDPPQSDTEKSTLNDSTQNSNSPLKENNEIINKLCPLDLQNSLTNDQNSSADVQSSENVNSSVENVQNLTENVLSSSTNGTDKPTTPELPKPTPQLLSRHDELKERARQLLEATKREAREKERSRRQKEESENETNGDLSPKKQMTEEERQTMLRERARKLIADARAGIVSPTSPLSPSRGRPTVEIISKQTVMDEIAAAGGVEQLDALLSRDGSTPNSRKSLSPERSDSRNSDDSKSGKSPQSEDGRFTLHSFCALVDRLTPDKEGELEKIEPTVGESYIASEVAALEREQRAVDARAAALEKQLRQVMDAPHDNQEEALLMSQWFNLVNKKNALLRRQMQLNILEQEEDLSRRCELLARELRLSLAVEEWRKGPGQKRRERLLLQELLSAVNERDRLVQEMDEQEKAIADDAEIEHNLSQVEMDGNRKQNCVVQ